MTSIIINPGSGPVKNRNGGPATLENAELNMVQFLADSMPGLTYERISGFDEGGRFGFIVKRAGFKDIAVDMPGLPLENVRYMGSENQNIFNFPRLYVDGDSWVWMYAVIDEGNYQTEEED